ncbi:4-hydroxy-tetrahydrodipicolinate synthase [Echinicola strongylocentroti]|uniref:4-hydroxy-tetrahydrodipicolinate synthase n=1 Tax=Echinicola strongylocentroti TaxID=1795355 RepID=A0A2Z4IEH3_9BACT|nr:4-hydroxy-tetrahydrodipicolinate synthase [Echinicola strongylocentroti]AWW29255.1 4-hydroxy-tetrahydrodipicolinate synthase [Echinicola strongylocentroti]
MEQFIGTGVALVTPLDEEGNIDFNGLDKVIEHVIQGGADYLVVMGTTGEASTMSRKEKHDILAASVKTNNGRLPIVYGIGANNTQAAIDEINDTDLSGVSALLSVSPYYNKPTQEGIYQHYIAVADASPVPIILYNVPGRTMSNITAETTLRLSDHAKIIGAKEASGDMVQCMEIVRKKPSDFLLISGDDMLTTSLKAIGGQGAISVLANAYPDIFKTICHGTQEESLAATFRLLDINSWMYAESNPVGVKNLLKHMGVCGDQVRLPLLRATEGLDQKIKQLAEGV